MSFAVELHEVGTIDIPIVELDHNLDIVGLQNEDGSFSGDMWGEVDTRYSFLLNSSLFKHIYMGFAIGMFISEVLNQLSVLGSLMSQFVVSH